MTIDYEQIWQAMPNPAFILDASGKVHAVNGSGENFLAMSAKALVGRQVSLLVGHDSRLSDLISRVQARGEALSEYNIEFNWPDTPVRITDIAAVPMEDKAVLIILHPRANAEAIGRHLSSRDAARSVVGMASMLAHEIKNPLAGISGAAQLLEMSLPSEDVELTTLIQEEADRIEKLVNRVEEFGDINLVRRQPVNIHDVLDRAAKSAKAGFASHVRFVEEYDPSLPPTLSDADQLIQVFMNLLKNAAEAAPPVGGVIMLKSAYRAGLKVRTGGGHTESLPMQVTISDNGSGVPDDLKPHIFEPFVTSKSTGSGLGLALCSKIITDHGGVISCDSSPGFTTFRMMLPIASRADLEAYETAQEDAA
ncbi:MAG: ATP-binding protein [Pseudomonadota bacterium]